MSKGKGMNDQAATLRVLRGGKPTESPVQRGRRAIAVTGGKGGVGKSTCALNLAIAYAQAGARTLLVDTDLGMADLNLLLGVAPDKTVLDALSGTPIEDVLVDVHGISLLPGLNGSYLLATIGSTGQRKIIELVDRVSEQFDQLVIDVAAGIGQAQTTFAGRAAEALVVVNPEPLSMADSYAALKVLSTEQGVEHAFILPNRVTSRTQADDVIARLKELVARFLDLEVTALPSIPADPTVQAAAQVGVPLMVYAPDCPAARAMRQVSRALSTMARSNATWWRSPATAEQGGLR
jgi:flagellar biosynthesis protein FlhG